MPETNFALLVIVTGFVASHFLLSHPLRRPLFQWFGPDGFALLYAVIAFAGLTLVVIAYHNAPHVPVLWDADNITLQLAFDALSFVAVGLFLASFVDNPALFGANMTGLSTRAPQGVYLITRHPMMMAIALLCAAQIMLTPSPRNAIACGGMIVLALVGARLQDSRKLAQSPRGWALWVSRTRFWPNPLRLPVLGFAWGLAVPVWLVVTWVQMRTTTTPCGIWYFLSDYAA